MITLFCAPQENLAYKTKDEQMQLLQKVLAATEMDAEEERGPGDGTGSQVRTGRGSLVMYEG